MYLYRREEQKSMERVYQTPLWDKGISWEERLEYLIGELTLEEKIQCMGTGCPDIPRLGIRAFSLGGEGAHGIQARHDQTFDRGDPDLTTIFPNPIGMSATWDRELIRQAGQVTGTEARGLYSREKKGSLCVWAPTIDMERDPRWGRTEEAYGEDPCLAGEMAGAYVEGIQGEDPDYLRCGATVKHFYANNVEEGRVWKSSTVDPRNKWEYYLEPFRQVIEEHGAEGLMTAYNEVNGVPCILNEEVQKIAKDRWGLHHVVCDGGDMSQTVEFHHYYKDHSETIAGGLRAGIDCFTDNIELVQDATREALERGLITEEELDRALRNHFGTMFRLGLFDPDNPYAEIGMDQVGTSEHHQIARRVAEEAVVLLKNKPGKEGKPLLPLRNPSGKIAVLGPLADVWYKDWYSGIPPYAVNPIQGLETTFGRERLLIERGTERMRLRLADGSYLGLLSDGRTVGRTDRAGAECFELERWDEEKITLRSLTTGRLLTTEDDFARGQEGLVTASKEEAFGWFVKETFLLDKNVGSEDKMGDSVSERQDAEKLSLTAWNGDTLLFDDEDRLCVKKRKDQAADARTGVAGTTDQQSIQGGSGLIVIPEYVKHGIREAVEAAKLADTVLLFLGPNPMINCKEEIDRTHLELPPYQQKLAEQVFAANENVILVLISSIPFTIGWAKEHIKAILLTATGGMELGNALANVISGKVNPAGRLPMTWYASERDLPPMDDYDIIKGERTYQYFRGKTLYPFGHGLTYGRFQYEDLRVSQAGEDRLHISVRICNTGERVADEVVQIYGRKRNPSVKRPQKQLLAFERVKGMEPGETRIAEWDVPLRRLWYYEVIRQNMILENGEYEIMAGGSSEDILLRQNIILPGMDRGVRRERQIIPADHYDRYHNALLREGHAGLSAVCPVDQGQWMELEYEQVLIDSDHATVWSVVLDAELPMQSVLEIYADNRRIGVYKGTEKTEPDRGKRKILLSDVPRGKVFTLKLRCFGAVKLCSLEITE